MKKLLALFWVAFFGVATLFAQGMSDAQVIEYVKNAQAAGKSQKEMTTELLRRGVTQEQVLRIKKQYEDGKKDVTESESITAQFRKRKNNDDTPDDVKKDENNKQGLLDGIELEQTNENYDDSRSDNNRREQEKDENITTVKSKIFGHSLFENKNLSFEPNVNVATPENYRLGPGDEVIIDIWGASENTIRQQISPEGNIQVSGIGPVHLNGMTIKEANSYLQGEFAKIYAGIGGDQPSSQIKLTLGDVRTILINVMGEVAVPGTYRLSSFSSVFHALYRAGGVNDIGSLRNIQVVRAGKVIANVDVYQIIMNGRLSDDIRLQEGDFILVKPYETLVKIEGKVKRPMFYEMKPTETVATIIDYAGGFTGDAYKKAVRLIRKSSGREYQVFNVDEMDFSVFRLEDGDEIATDSILNRFENKVEIRGAVYRPGLYQLNKEVGTVKELIKKAEGLRGDAFMNRALLDREHEDLSHEVVAIDLRGLLDGTFADIPLQKNDVLYVSSIVDMKEEETVSIHGEVANPGVYRYSDNTTIEDLIFQAGGLKEAAATTMVNITRRIKSPKSKEFSNSLGEVYTFDITDGLVVGGESFYLKPYDEVYIRKSPAYKQQQNVVISGEVLFDGTYSLLKKNERISDVIARAGGVTPDAYVKGARLLRKMTEEERRRQEDAVRIAKSSEGRDSISVEKLNVSDIFTVGIRLDLALENPGSDYDIVMREGDVLYVPEYISTVKISGAVMYPNTVSYKEGANLKYYINQAGGYGNLAKKRKAYVIYMNGTVSRLKSTRRNAIEPGCEIIVPSKEEKKRMSTAEILSMGSSAASLAAVIASLVNLFK
ncbi:SLBB domain-containing protein [Mediterranea massiliensis]|uniref:SLBB domain-containing protein n=1 Tax=Mediterranea massiliensis TaxID=1841865 RepID=UPI0025A434B9|nr:SLBB domain-containing protein [Mediterranea massiliensis]MDM8338216.1 SLBB domain-containing protein [Mediterranea massiliensis]